MNETTSTNSNQAATEPVQGASVTMPSESLFGGQQNKIDITPFIPEPLKEKEWVKNALKTENPIAEIIKQNDNAQSLIGKKANAIEIPGPEATPEDWNKYAEAATKAYTVESYTFKPTEWAAEEAELGKQLEASTPKAVLEGMAKAAKARGVTPVQLQGLKSDMDKIQLQLVKEQQAQWQKAAADYEKDFDTRTSAAFGDKKDAILSGGKELLKQHVPDNLKEDLKSLDNKSLVILAAALGSVGSKYIKEDSFKTGSSGSAPLSEASVREEGRKLMSFVDESGRQPYTDITHPRHDEFRRKVNETFAQLSSIQKM